MAALVVDMILSEPTKRKYRKKRKVLMKQRWPTRISGAGKGARGGGCPPMLKKMAFVTLPNSMRKLGRGWVSISDGKKIINTKYF